MPAPTILVTGGTGTLGTHVVRRLRADGHEVRILSRNPGSGRAVGDLQTGAGVAAALSGVETVVHCAGEPKRDAGKAQTLVDAARTAGVRHLVNISVVGADRIPVTSAVDRAMFGYFGQQREAEQVISGSGVPYTTLRASQFFDLILATVSGLAKLPVVPVPRVRFQPIEADEVAARLVSLALAEPAGLVDEMAGPRTYPLAELTRGYLRAIGRHRPLVTMPTAGAAARAVRAGANLAPEHAVGKRTWEEFLAERVGSPR